MIAGDYQPLMEKAGARLFGIWESSLVNSQWPEITTIWEIDSYKHLAQIGGSRRNDPANRKDFAQWMGLLGEIDGHGEGRLCFGNAGIKTVEERKAEGFQTTFMIEEIMQTKPNGQTKYVEELEYLYVSWSEDTGKKWLGSFTTVFRYDEVIHYWACDGGWDVFANHFPSWEQYAGTKKYRRKKTYCSVLWEERGRAARFPGVKNFVVVASGGLSPLLLGLSPFAMHGAGMSMLTISAGNLGVLQGSRMLFSDFADGGPMWVGEGAREARQKVVFSWAFSPRLRR